jgi:hypothetical protein
MLLFSSPTQTTIFHDSSIILRKDDIVFLPFLGQYFALHILTYLILGAAKIAKKIEIFEIAIAIEIRDNIM